MWQKLVGRLFSGGEQQLDAFLDDLIALSADSTLDGDWHRWGTIRFHFAPDSMSAPELRYWEQLLKPIRQRHADSEAMALHWVCAVDERLNRVQAEAQRRQLRYPLEPLKPMLALLWMAPPTGTADALFAMLNERLAAVAANPTQQGAAERDAVTDPVPLLLHLDGELDRGRRLVLAAVAQHARVRSTHGVPRWSVFEQLCAKLIDQYSVPLVAAGLLSEAEYDAVLVEFPRHVAQFGQQRSAHAGWENARDEALGRLIRRVLDGDPDSQLGEALWHYPFYAGMSHFLAACRMLDRDRAAKFPLDPWYDSTHPMAWAARGLRMLPAPAPADSERGSELAQISPETLQTATLLAPAWAALIDGHTGWPGWGGIVRWLARYGGPGPWSGGAPQASDEEAEEGGGAGDQTALKEAVAAMGGQRFKQLLKHRVARGLYRNGLFYAQAVLGLNAADVEEKFLKRNKQAVVALGMLPDEGDLLQRYLALRRFAKESRQFGAQRQASEQIAVERALDNLAVTAGYEDRAQLEWSMEAQLVEEIDPGRRWQIGEYTVWLEADEAAMIRTERGGKLLKSVPPAVRQAEAYAEIKEAREQLQAQWDRVRRRLELAMVLGEVMDREAFAPALITPAGRAMLPHLVMRCWAPGSDQPSEALGPVEGAERYQVAHPLDLAAAGTLAQWQARLVQEGRRQPFNQLFRECYRPTVMELANQDCQRFNGRKVRVGTLKDKLKRSGWRMGYEGQLERRLPGRAEASLWFADGVAYMEALEVVTIGGIGCHGPSVKNIGDLHPRVLSEVLRDVDLATLAAAPDGQGPVSPEILNVRAALARALGCTVEAEYAVTPAWQLHLETGAAFDAQGGVLELRKTALPDDFPYTDPHPATADVMSRLLELIRRK